MTDSAVDLDAAVCEALRTRGIRAYDLELVADGPRRILRSSIAEVVVRIHASEVSADELTIHLDQVRSLIRNGARLIAPVVDEPIQLPHGRVASVWPLASPAHPDVQDLAEIFRSLHDCPDPGLDPWDNLDAIRLGLKHLSSLDGDRQGLFAALLRWADALQATKPAFSRIGPVHADAHAGNVMEVAGRCVLIDLDGLASGPPEIDLAVPLTDHRRSGYPIVQIDRLAACYGVDRVDDETLAWCCDFRELNVISWLASAGTSRPNADAELARWTEAAAPSSGWWKYAG